MSAQPAIIVSAFNRPEPLKRLLNSLANAVYDTDDVELVISIDKSDSDNVLSVAQQFEWRHGSKKIISHEQHLGLKAHILSCGALTSVYDSILVLEDDLLVSPYFYNYSIQALNHYKNDANIAGISLYNYEVAESCFYPFKAIDDGSDVYFMQVASSWGQLWTKQQWQSFRDWFIENPELLDTSEIPGYIKIWGTHSWKKHFIHYLIATNTYFVFPRLSLTTNFEEQGTNASTTNTFHVPLQISNKDYTFISLSESKATYDAWFELLPACMNTFNPSLKQFDYVMDLYGVKEITKIQNKFILTSKKGNNALASFAMDLFPFELNVAFNLPGHGFAVYELNNGPFTSVKLNKPNLLEEQDRRSRDGISVVITFGGNLNDLNVTLDSVLKQEYKNRECIIICDSKTEALHVLISDYDFKIKIIEIDTSVSLYDQLLLGLKNATQDFLTWIMPGSLFSEDAFLKAENIFRSNAGIDWIRGVDEIHKNKKEYAEINTRTYRLTSGEAYKKLEENRLNFSIELDFFRRNCLSTLEADTNSIPTLFFKFISHYKLYIIVARLGSSKQNLSTIPTSEAKLLLEKYSHLKIKDKFLTRLIGASLQLPFIKTDISKWYYTTLNNFPDVLRYDEVNATFYFSKY